MARNWFVFRLRCKDRELFRTPEAESMVCFDNDNRGLLIGNIDSTIERKSQSH